MKRNRVKAYIDYSHDYPLLDLHYLKVTYEIQLQSMNRLYRDLLGIGLDKKTIRVIVKAVNRALEEGKTSLDFSL